MSDSKIAKDLIRPDDGTGKNPKGKRQATAEMKIENLALLRCVTHLLNRFPFSVSSIDKWILIHFWPRLGNCELLLCVK